MLPPSDLGTLYSDHHGWLQGWLRRKMGNACDAADLAHDTFLRVLARRDTPRLLAPRAYLGAIARGLVADFFRHQDIERAYLDALAALPETHAPSLEARAIVLEALVAIDTMLDGLKPAVRQAFLLSQLDGLTYEQIAQQLGVTKRTVSNYMCTAIGHCVEHCDPLAP
ncbi:sigma-70 family RNA polymerase sigma factor [Janthinobacterium psychrotolerans]|uniref:RNA polymerase sigma-70 factor, ECF subfamily n=1 Tax=Janthinobacterium psychrotolerans TaxID=1747903 RepID=A0A1A7C4Z0_9BURK|nr:sigma-70 family RNA polymerase sigma factor [Janthinobacterium psychrotolerans]OBV40109.1 RNA polymerase sigma-70 factor, ECF subfamily [Janthinobacterium psychrotolerans]